MSAICGNHAVIGQDFKTVLMSFMNAFNLPSWWQNFEQPPNPKF